MALSQEARCRALYLLNIAVTSGLALHFLLAPAAAAAAHFGDTRVTGGAGLMAAPGSGLSPTLAYRMLGAWWAAVAAVSLLGLGEPLKYSPVFLMQAAYKLVYLPVAIAPLVAAGRWGAFPKLPTAVFAGYLAPLFYCTPWSYLLGSARVGKASLVGAPAAPAGGDLKAE